jgi:hypothetical protein
VSVEQDELESFIKNKVAEYVASGGAPVGWIQAGYCLDQSMFITIFIDGSDDAGPNGLWTMRTEGNSFDVDHWPMYQMTTYKKSS